jgi:hypothetical protein
VGYSASNARNNGGNDDISTLDLEDDIIIIIMSYEDRRNIITDVQKWGRSKIAFLACFL